MYIVVLITTPTRSESRRIASTLLAKRLCACVNIVDGVSSLFWWQGKIDKAKESLLVVKTTRGKFAQLVKDVRAMHSYTVPEIIALPIVAGNKAYLEWLSESVR